MESNGRRAVGENWNRHKWRAAWERAVGESITRAGVEGWSVPTWGVAKATPQTML